MTENDRMERLEARVARLEELLAGKRGSGEAGKSENKLEGSETARPLSEAAPVGAKLSSPRPRVPASPRPVPPPRLPASPLSSEEFIGQRVLLAVGVVALILAAGYLLRLSFDRGGSRR
jgi:hypothetical protein